MIFIARPFPPENHTCVNYLQIPEELYFELVQEKFDNTCIHDIIEQGNTIKISKTTCNKCNRTYYIANGLDFTCVMNSDNQILRGYKNKQI